ncbi:hypothetical protein SY2F82_77130 [Streptomyces sp. Y2F8-2]|nr:hypothetical protein [Streptomyces sp. Y2F8-2]GHK05916.1 hypothetical protein SY2F82_77130 [Streptomyces sp. Y2F8-2]
MPERYAFVDAAKLISRTVLTLAAFRPGPETGKRVTRRIDVSPQTG